jgi:hypothetical protein
MGSRSGCCGKGRKEMGRGVGLSCAGDLFSLLGPGRAGLGRAAVLGQYYAGWRLATLHFRGKFVLKFIF